MSEGTEPTSPVTTAAKAQPAMDPFYNMLGVIAKSAFVLALLLVLGYAVGYQAQILHFPYAADYGEGPLMDQAARLAQGQSIYRNSLATAPFTISNYPPLYVALLALLGRLFGMGNLLLLGRMLSVISAWVAVGSVGWVVWKGTRNGWAALAAAGVLAAAPFFVFWSPLLRIDMLALAFATLALALLVGQADPGKGRLVLVGLLLLAAIYTRQSYALAAPLAAFAWLLPRGVKRAFAFALGVGAAALALFGLLNWLTDGGFYFNIVAANLNKLDWAGSGWHWIRLRDALPFPLALSLVSVFLFGKRNPLWPLSSAFLVGAGLSALTIAKVGSNVNYFLELGAALAIASGSTLAWAMRPAGGPASGQPKQQAGPRPAFNLMMGAPLFGSALLALLAGAYVSAANYSFNNFSFAVNYIQTNRAELDQLYAVLQASDGPALADDQMVMIARLGRPLYMQPFEVTQLAFGGVWDQTPLVQALEKQEIAVVAIMNDEWAKPTRWTPEMLAALEKYYRVTHNLANTLVYQPYRPLVVSYDPASCPGSALTLPGNATRGLRWQNGGIAFYGQGALGKVPVYAAADGMLFRSAETLDTLTLLIADPLRPGQQASLQYSGMANATNSASTILPQFEPGADAVPVKAGQLLGYQGVWSGKAGWQSWVNVRVAITAVEGGQPLDPAAYFGLDISPEGASTTQQALACK